MLKRFLAGLFVAYLWTGARAFAADNVNFDQGVGLNDVKSIIQSVQAAAENSAAPRPASMQDRETDALWNIMVYVNAKNNLESYGLKDVNEMEMVGSSDKVKVTVELGRLGWVEADGGWKGERRYVIGKDDDTSKITSPYKQLPASDMGDWRHLVDFVNWAKAEAPAQHYMLIVWNHGSGWDKARVSVWTRGISYDQDTGHHITTQELGQALAAVGKLDVYGSDACLMQMAEVGYQLKDSADLIVGSEETEPGDGYTYDALLAPLAAQPAMTSFDAAQVAVKTYTEHYAEIDRSVTQSALRSAAFGQLIPLLDDWTSAVIAADEKGIVRAAYDQTQDFSYAENKDLLHFIKLVDKASANEAVRSKGALLEEFLSAQLIASNAASGRYDNAFGLAIYLTDSGYPENYMNLAWAKDSQWPRFLQWMRGV